MTDAPTTMRSSKITDAPTTIHRADAEPGWRLARTLPSLPEVFASVRVPRTSSFWRKLLAFPGPGLMVAVGYMDPGNWATDLAGGAQFGYLLLSVMLISNFMAILLQHLSLKLGIVDRARPGAGLPRPLLAAGRAGAVDAVRDRDRRLRPGRGDRLGDRAQPAVRHPAARRRAAHRRRCAGGAVPAESRASATSRRWSARPDRS